eukprot:765551-Hanusia_phi.AAC.3
MQGRLHNICGHLRLPSTCKACRRRVGECGSGASVFSDAGCRENDTFLIALMLFLTKLEGMAEKSIFEIAGIQGSKHAGTGSLVQV